MGNLTYGVIEDNKIIKTVDENNKEIDYDFSKYYTNGFIELDINVKSIFEKISKIMEEDDIKNIKKSMPILISTILMNLNKIFLIKKTDKKIIIDDEDPLKLIISILVPFDYFDSDKIDIIYNKLNEKVIENLENEKPIFEGEMTGDISTFISTKKNPKKNKGSVSSKVEYKKNKGSVSSNVVYKNDENSIDDLKQYLKIIIKTIKHDKYFKVRISNIVGLFLSKGVDIMINTVKINNNKNLTSQERVKKITEEVVTQVYENLVPTTCNFDLNDVNYFKIRYNNEKIDWCKNATTHPSCPPVKGCPSVKECPPVKGCPSVKECPPSDNTIPYMLSGVLGILLVVFMILYFTKKSIKY